MYVAACNYKCSVYVIVSNHMQYCDKNTYIRKVMQNVRSYIITLYTPVGAFITSYIIM